MVCGNLQVLFDDVASAVAKWMAGAGGAAVSATGVTTDGAAVQDSCLTVAAVATKAIMCVPFCACKEHHRQFSAGLGPGSGTVSQTQLHLQDADTLNAGYLQICVW